MISATPPGPQPGPEQPDPPDHPADPPGRFDVVGRMRREYPTTGGLAEPDLAGDWLGQFDRWLTDAVAADVPEPNAMVLATADPTGRPSARTVLLKAYDERGFVLFTNLASRKGVQARANPYASLVFCWLPLHRQVVVTGTVTEVVRAEVARYFADRPRGAQLAAWASRQSEVIPSRRWLTERFARTEARFPDAVPAPGHWGGLRVVPETVEFWQGRADRLHDRLRFRRAGADRTDEGWVVERLAP